VPQKRTVKLILKKGHAVMFEVASSAHPHYSRNPGTGMRRMCERGRRGREWRRVEKKRMERVWRERGRGRERERKREERGMIEECETCEEGGIRLLFFLALFFVI
jgi:hypothetical protein